MPAQILAPGTGDTDSDDVVVTSELTVALNGEGGGIAKGASVNISLKDAAGNYWPVDRLTVNRPALVLSAGTWRFSRGSGPPCGVFSA